MQSDLIPQRLQADYYQFLHHLKQLGGQAAGSCPHCKSRLFSQIRTEPLTFRCKSCLKYFNPLTGTQFNRLQPVAWLPVILSKRVDRKSYQTIADRLDCDIKKIMRRDKAIKAQMQLISPDLYNWYCNHNNADKQFDLSTINNTILVEQNVFNHKLNEILNTINPPCRYCKSVKTVKVGQCASFRCNQCRRGFSLLHGTPILRLPRVDLWFNFVDQLVAQKSNGAIANDLGMNRNTIRSWRRRWCDTMQLWGFSGLSLWCKQQ
ncbi:hypothetical protein PT276_05595 [Orbaceae bacterium ESL0721]|nr:hypothetical protein [Orbaceae bacterium ESL0721]